METHYSGLDGRLISFSLLSSWKVRGKGSKGFVICMFCVCVCVYVFVHLLLSLEYQVVAAGLISHSD